VYVYRDEEGKEEKPLKLGTWHWSGKKNLEREGRVLMVDDFHCSYECSVRRKKKKGKSSRGGLTMTRFGKGERKEKPGFIKERAGRT